MSKRTVLAWFGCFLFPAVVGTRSADAQCIDWKSGFGPPVIGTDARVSAEIVFDDGSGPALYLGGAFQSAGGSTTSSTVRWRGSSWSSLGFGFGTVRAFAVSGASGSSSLYRAGLYSSVDRWTGTSWSPLPGQLHGSPGQGYALASFDDGSGPALYVGGSFDSINAVPMNGIARWNGSTWSPLGSGLGESYAEVQALAVFDDGTGPALYAAGYFDSVGGVSAANIAKWNGSSWSALGGGLDAVATSLGVFDDGSGAALYAGGSFTNAGGQSAAHIAKWNGSSWSSLAGGTDGSVDSLQVWNDGGGTALFAGGKFTNAGGQPSNHFARWNGSSWQPVGNGVAGNASSDVYGLAVFDDGSGAALYAGGEFTTAGSAQANNIARWNASNWSSLGPAGPGMNGQVNALKSYDDGSGSALYAGGTFTDAGGALVTALAKWNGSSWSHVGTGLTALQVTALEVADVGSGPELYVGGAFMSPGHRLVRWNGSSWSAVGGDVNNVVWALTAFPASSGSVLYAGGNFTMAGSTAVSYVARFDGANWTALGSGLDNSVYALAVFDDGSGPALYAGGNFTNAGGSAASAIAKWDGTSWSALGAGLGGVSLPVCDALIVHDDGSGPALYAGGYFYTAGGVPVSNIAKWNGTSWSAVGGGTNGTVQAFANFDDGTGPALFAAGAFGFAGNVLVRNIARWNGSTWSAIASGTNDTVDALAVFDDGSAAGPDLYAGGVFTNAGLTVSSRIAEIQGCAGPGTLFCFGDGTNGACPCSNSGEPGHGCQNSISSGGAQLYSSGTTVPDTVVLHASGELATALSIVLQGNAQNPPAHFGDGLRCAGGTLKRLYVKSASAGVVSAPQPGDPSITARSAALGDTIVHGSTRYYQTYYRDSNLSYCPAPSGDSWNVTNGVAVVW